LIGPRCHDFLPRRRAARDGAATGSLDFAGAPGCCHHEPAALGAAAKHPGEEGPPKALWRFDQTEGTAFFEAAGFTVVQTEAHRTTNLDLSRYERIPGRTERLEIGGDTARMMALVDGHRTVRDIADVLKESVPSQPVAETMSAFARYFDRGLLSWRKRDR
jgi:hypothetical protein